MTIGPQDPRPEQDVMRPAQEQDVIEILLDQHQGSRRLLADVNSARSRKQQAFEDLGTCSRLTRKLKKTSYGR